MNRESLQLIWAIPESPLRKKINFASRLMLAMVLLAFCVDAVASDQVPAPPQDHPIALVNGSIHTICDGVIENGTVLFEDGKIVEIGKDISLPENTEKIIVSGKHVYPGLISSDTILGLVEISAVRATRDFSETGQITPEVRTEVAINPDSELIPVTRATGITLALTVPQGGYISGTSALIMLDGWTWEDMTLKAPVGMHVRWPSMHIDRSSGNAKRAMERRDERVQIIRDAFDDARAYRKAKKAESEKVIPHHETDVRWESMIPVLEKKIPVFVHAGELQQIQSAVEWAKEENVNMILVGGKDAWRAADLLKENDIPVIIGEIHTTPMRRWENYDTPYKNPLKLYEADVQFCIAGSRGVIQEMNLPYEAATAAAHGLPKEEALKAITLYPAQILGVEDRVGSIEKGKDATLIVTDGEILEITTKVELEFIQGRQIDLTSRHTQLYDKYTKKYQQLGILK